MPVWGQVILGVAAVVGAVAYLWKQVLRPGAQLISTMDKLLPVAKELAEQFHDAPEAFETLKAIAIQFAPDSGTTLRDVVNRLESAADENKAAAEVLKVNVEAAKQLAEQDRRQLANLMAKLDLANFNIDTAATDRIGIAADLEASHQRAESVPDPEPGAAADAAMKRDDDAQG